jgi:hypothetical protein
VAAGEGERQQVPSIKHDENQVNSFFFLFTPIHFQFLQVIFLQFSRFKPGNKTAAKSYTRRRMNKKENEGECPIV